MIEDIDLKVRFKDAVWFEQVKKEYGFLLGCGGINSNLGFLLNSMGLKLMVWDNDTVGVENMGAQNFNLEQIGLNKVDAFKANCYNYLGDEGTIETVPELYTEKSYSNYLVFAGFDNMLARKLAFDKWVKIVEKAPEEDKSKFLFIDGRLNPNKYQIFCVTHKSISRYRDTLFDDSEVEDLPCTYKATRFASWGIASDMAAIFINYCANKACNEEDLYEIPFSLEKEYEFFNYKIEN